MAKNYQDRTKKELADLARKRGVAGWHEMRKEELIAALAKPKVKAAVKKKTAAAPRPRPQLAAEAMEMVWAQHGGASTLAWLKTDLDS